jgi:peptide/nickel transport system substrate-binding protein
MHRKSLLSLFMLSMGAALIVAAMAVGVASARTQATRNLVVTQGGGAFDTLDPQLAYVSNDWGLQYNTELTLLNFPTAAGTAGTKLIPQAASAMPAIANGGRQYTFHIRPGLKLSDGSSVSAANFQRAFERNLSPQMYAQWGIADGLDQFLVGGAKFAAGKAAHISGVDANGLTLTIHLTRVVPQFTSIMGMPWFQAVPSNLAYSNNKGGIRVYASGGPYYIYSNNLNKLTVLKRNKHWQTSGYFTSNWPSNPDVITIKSTPNSDGTAELLQAEKGQVDLAGVASQDIHDTVQTYGINKKTSKGELIIGPTTCILWNAMNDLAQNGTTKKTNVRKALNYAMSRTVQNSYYGEQAGKASEQILVPAIPGYNKLTYYGGTGDLTKAKNVGGTDLKDAPLNIYYRASSTAQSNIAEYMRSQAVKLGMKPNLTPADPADYYGALETKATATGSGGYNITASGGWCADYEDGYDYFNVNFDGRNIQPTGNADYMYFNNATFNSHMDAAAAKTGSARATAYGNLDKEFMQTYAPLIPREIPNSREFAAPRVGNYIYSTWWGQGYWNAIKVPAT